MRENKLNRHWFTAVKKRGGICPKFIAPGLDGMPDRWCFFCGNENRLCRSLKRRQKSTAFADRRHGMLRRLGFPVYVLDDINRLRDTGCNITA